jgi:hypothetical protein
MRRALTLLSVLLAALAVAAPNASAAAPKHGLYFNLHAKGFWINAKSAVGSDRLRLLLDRHGEVAYYYVDAKVGEDSLRARFGGLGEVDFQFRPRAREGKLGCGHAEGGWQQGTFRGSLVFRGEHDYAMVDAHRARGWMKTLPRHCGGGGGGREEVGGEVEIFGAPARASSTIAETGARLEALAGPRLPSTFFDAYIENRAAGIRTVFNGLRQERRGGMFVMRGAQVYGGASSFTWDLGAGTAVVAPPAPFTGRAYFKREASGGRWTGSLRVPILGGAPLRLTGAAFAAHLGADT